MRKDSRSAAVASDVPPRPAPELSLAAELLLLSFDPRRGRLYATRAGRLSIAVGVADVADQQRVSVRHARLWLVGRRATRRALDELCSHGMVARTRRPHLLDRAALAERYNRLAACMRADEFPDPRDRTLVLLLAWTGVLAQRLRGRDPRWFKRMIESLLPEPGSSSPVLPPGISHWVATLSVFALSTDVAAHFETHAADRGGTAAVDGGTSHDGGGPDW